MLREDLGTDIFYAFEDLTWVAHDLASRYSEFMKEIDGGELVMPAVRDTIGLELIDEFVEFYDAVEEVIHEYRSLIIENGMGAFLEEEGGRYIYNSDGLESLSTTMKALAEAKNFEAYLQNESDFEGHPFLNINGKEVQSALGYEKYKSLYSDLKTFQQEKAAIDVARDQHLAIMRAVRGEKVYEAAYLILEYIAMNMERLQDAVAGNANLPELLAEHAEEVDPESIHILIESAHAVFRTAMEIAKIKQLLGYFDSILQNS